jgi:predicted CopG family antitoxin
MSTRVEKSKYTRKCTYVLMAHKTLTISEEAYNALARIKSKDESFTKVILRLAQRRSKGNLLEYVRSFPADNELADKIEEVLKKRGSIRIRATGR